jgi:hypothetical protein
VIFYKARIIRVATAKHDDEWWLLPPQLLARLDYGGLPIQYTHDLDSEPIGLIVAAEYKDGFVTATLQLWELPRVVGCSLYGEISPVRKSGHWGGLDYDAIIREFDLQHLALVERPFFAGCHILEEVPVDVALGWPTPRVALLDGVPVYE